MAGAFFQSGLGSSRIYSHPTQTEMASVPNSIPEFPTLLLGSQLNFASTQQTRRSLSLTLPSRFWPGSEACPRHIRAIPRYGRQATGAGRLSKGAEDNQQ